MVAMRCFVWPLVLQLWSGSDADQNMGLKNSITSHLCFIVINTVFDIKWSKTIL